MGIEAILGKRRASLILLHPTSLPDPAGKAYGIGELGSEAFRFIDFLAASGVLVWQILPLGHTGYKDSPYQTSSRFAGSPYLVSVEQLLRAGDLTRRQHADYVARVRAAESPAAKADFGWLFRNKVGKDWNDRAAVLRQAFRGFCRRRADDKRRAAFREFCLRERKWLDDYAEYMAIKESHGHRPWIRWRPEFRDVDVWRAHRRELLAHTPRLARSLGYYKYLQFVFFEQWRAVRDHARKKGRKIVGDIPWYVGYDSADVWAHREIFDLDGRGRPNHVAGVPPDYFSRTGQLWGNPLYRWDHPKTLEWWGEAIEFILTQVDVLRMDHLRAIDSYWKIPYAWAVREKTAKKGVWAKGPGRDLLDAIRARLRVAGGGRGARGGRGLPIIAEDLGFLDPLCASPRDYPRATEKDKRYRADRDFARMIRNKDSRLRSGLNATTGEYSTRRAVDAILAEFDLPWMAVAQFGFEGDNRHVPSKLPANSVVYTGTHDNNTAVGWYLDMVEKENQGAADPMGNTIVGASNFDKYARRLARTRPRREKRLQRNISRDMIEAAFGAPSGLAGAPMQDFLNLGSDARMNLPGDMKGSWWTWRATREQLDYEKLSREIRLLNAHYKRLT